MSLAVLPANSIFPGKLNSQEKLPEAVAEFPASVIAEEALFYSQDQLRSFTYDPP